MERVETMYNLTFYLERSSGHTTIKFSRIFLAVVKHKTNNCLGMMFCWERIDYVLTEKHENRKLTFVCKEDEFVMAV